MRSRILSALAVLLSSTPVLAQSAVNVSPTLQSQPVPGSGRVIQGAAVWVHPTDPTHSQLLVSDNQNGLLLYNTDGGLRGRLLEGAVQGVDVQEGVPVSGVSQQFIMVANTSRGLVSYILDPTTLAVQKAGVNDYGTGSVVANSVALFKSPTSNVLYAFAGSNAGTLGQYEINTQVGDGGVVTPVRTLSVGGAVVGLTVDDSQGKLYVAVQNIGIWQYGAEPDAGDGRISVDDLTTGRLVGPLGGLALYTGAGTDGYLLAVTGNDNAVRVYERNPAVHTYRGTFTSIATTTIDGVDKPRVLAVSNRSLLPDFPSGMVAVQDSTTAVGNENLKLVPWDRVATAFPSPLVIYNGATSPDAGTDGGTADAGEGGQGGTVPGGGGGGGGLPSFPNPSPPGCNCSSASLPGTMLLVLAGLLLARRRHEE